MDIPSKPQAQQGSSRAVLTRLRQAKWYAFDLDDTLHSFRKASAAAVQAVLAVIHENSNCTLEELDEQYRSILAQSTASAFVDGKTSHQYREDRFRQLAKAFEIELANGHLESLTKLYEKTLTRNLDLKPGVVELFKTLKRYGHKIAVITEGPQDAQERTVKALRIEPFIHYLATTNKLGVAKTDGLFVKVLEHLNLETKDMIMIGDSQQRDVLPATQAGMFCFHYCEGPDESEGYDETRTIPDFERLRVFVETAHREGNI